MPSGSDLRFDPVTPAHYQLLRHWLAQPHWREWWGDPEIEFGYIRDMVEGRDTTKPFIFVVDDVPAGYIQYWFIGPHQTPEWTEDNPWLLELPSDAVGVDLSIGEVEHLSKGLGTAVLVKFVDMLRNMGHHSIFIDPDPVNRRAVRAYEKAGFLPVPQLAGRTDGVLIMQHHRTSPETQE